MVITTDAQAWSFGGGRGNWRGFRLYQPNRRPTVTVRQAWRNARVGIQFPADQSQHRQGPFMALPTLHLLCGKIASGKSTLAKTLTVDAGPLC